MTERKSNLLIGMEVITQYLKMSRPFFKRFIKNGMPVLLIGVRCPETRQTPGGNTIS